MRHYYLLAVGLLTLAATPWLWYPGRPRRQPAPGTSRVIYTTAESDSGASALLLDTETGRQKLLFRFPCALHDLRPSPDGSRFAGVLWTDELLSRVCLLTADGQVIAHTEASRVHTSPRWSPDSSRLLFVDSSGEMMGLYLMDADGRYLKRLTRRFRRCEAPSWSPDGSQILFHALCGSSVEVCLVRADGTGERALTHTRGSDHQPAWSPDGTRIAFVSARAGRPWLHEMRADGSRPRRLQRKAAGAWWPSWSPDGRQIAFLGGACHELSVWLIRTDGTAERRLATGAVTPMPAGPPLWLADGRRLLFVGRRPGDDHAALYVLDTDSGAYRILVRGVNLDAMPSLLPAPRVTTARSTSASRSPATARSRR